MSVYFILYLYVFAFVLALIIALVSQALIALKICPKCFKKVIKSKNYYTFNWFCPKCHTIYEIHEKIKVKKESRFFNKKQKIIEPSLESFVSNIEPKKYKSSSSSQFSEKLWNKHRKFK